MHRRNAPGESTAQRQVQLRKTPSHIFHLVGLILYQFTRDPEVNETASPQSKVVHPLAEDTSGTKQRIGIKRSPAGRNLTVDLALGLTKGPIALRQTHISSQLHIS